VVGHWSLRGPLSTAGIVCNVDMMYMEMHIQDGSPLFSPPCVASTAPHPQTRHT
jgi:hypothetical protein